jgi:FkbM family methyltransferase
MLNKFINYFLRKYYKNLGFYNSSALESYSELEKMINEDNLKHIRSLKRYQESSFEFLGKNIKFSDNEALIGMINEIFVKKNYMFNSGDDAPMIIDCGANIGLSAIFFKEIYPNSKIICFEPDPKIFEILKYNLEQFNYSDIQIYNTAVWVRNEKLRFQTDNSWGGKIVSNESKNYLNIDALDLNNFLKQKIDFLKIDIEGAEYDVIIHCKDLISKNVKNIFFEWHSFTNKEQKLGELLSFFEKNNFRYHLKEASPKGAPFIEKRFDQTMDTQIDCFIYKI